MKKSITLLLLVGLAGNLLAQETPEKVMEKRAREMFKAITVDDKDQWKKFITENYSQALIDKQMQSTVKRGENGEVVTSTQGEPKGSTNVEKKAAMLGQLHNDFGKSKISSLKIDGDKATMLLENPSGTDGAITLRFSTTKPYLIEGLGIELKN